MKLNSSKLETNINVNFDTNAIPKYFRIDDSLDKIVSLVTDKVMKSINNSHSSSNDSTIFVKFIQPMSHRKQSEDFKSEFRFDLSNIIRKAKLNYNGMRDFQKEEKERNLESERSNLSNGLNKSFRLIEYKGNRRMNLSEKPFLKRRFWHERMKKEKIDNIFVQVRRDVLKELKRKIYNSDFGRRRRKLSVREADKIFEKKKRLQGICHKINNK